MYVVDASSVVSACLADDGFEQLGDVLLVAPDLLWSETTSVLHEMAWRREISRALADIARGRLAQAPIKPDRREGLREEAWRVADELGWAKTHDAEYVALARLTTWPLITGDERLRRGASRVVDVVDPTQVS